MKQKNKKFLNQNQIWKNLNQIIKQKIKKLFNQNKNYEKF